jgi:hypothetical protein
MFLWLHDILFLPAISHSMYPYNFNLFQYQNTSLATHKVKPKAGKQDNTI